MDLPFWLLIVPVAMASAPVMSAKALGSAQPTGDFLQLWASAVRQWVVLGFLTAGFIDVFVYGRLSVAIALCELLTIVLGASMIGVSFIVVEQKRRRGFNPADDLPEPLRDLFASRQREADVMPAPEDASDDGVFDEDLEHYRVRNGWVLVISFVLLIVINVFIYALSYKGASISFDEVISKAPMSDLGRGFFIAGGAGAAWYLLTHFTELRGGNYPMQAVIGMFCMCGVFGAAAVAVVKVLGYQIP